MPWRSPIAAVDPAVPQATESARAGPALATTLDQPVLRQDLVGGRDDRPVVRLAHPDNSGLAYEQLSRSAFEPTSTT